MVPLTRVKQIAAAIVLAFSGMLIFLAIDGLTMPMRLTLAVFVATTTAWTILDLPDTPVALAGAGVLAVFGAIDEDVLYRSLGNEIVWLMLAAFVVAGVLRQVGVIEQIIRRLLARFGTVQGLFWALTFLIFATAFIIPSTSARAAMLAPVYLGLATAIGNARVNLALALLFPSVILLSAGASLIGAGAHLVAAGMMEHLRGQSPGFLSWIALAGPFSLLCSLGACAVLLRLFLTGDERAMAIAKPITDETPTSLTPQQWTVLAITGAMILLFAAQPMHGIGMPLIGIAAALLLANQRVSGLPLKTALKAVEWNLLLFLAGTLVIGEALLETGTAQVLAERMVGLAGNSIATWPALIIAFAAIVSTLSHLVITSRTARVTVLIPALALPAAALGVDPLNLVMVVTLGSGFCQTLMVSAKPVALFAAMDPPPFGQADLIRFAGLLIVPFVALIVVFATLAWPLQGLPLH
ncbi:SLC13 family permease [Neorhizobium galegae]|uniref:SLC13 family permease n=1 Tax=Neorhizobium galegae TaxID=399 RepID=UPI002105DF22|nr:SLC13 family permease [Neorhizobium galegae]MCQ1835113.1 SLC13 family permease [Neorhizobium galegae]